MADYKKHRRRTRVLIVVSFFLYAWGWVFVFSPLLIGDKATWHVVFGAIVVAWEFMTIRKGYRVLEDIRWALECDAEMEES